MRGSPTDSNRSWGLEKRIELPRSPGRSIRGVAVVCGLGIHYYNVRTLCRPAWESPLKRAVVQ
jgi:hypothetical protein